MCEISNQLAVNANADNQVDAIELANEKALSDLFIDGQADFSNGEIELYEAHDYAEKSYKETFDLLVLRIVSGDLVAIKGLQHLIRVSAIELNSSRGFNH